MKNTNNNLSDTDLLIREGILYLFKQYKYSYGMMSLFLEDLKEFCESEATKEIFKELDQIKDILLQIKSSNQKDYNLIFYTRKEAADLLRCSVQTINNYISDGTLKATVKGNKKMIHHYEIFGNVLPKIE